MLLRLAADAGLNTCAGSVHIGMGRCTTSFTTGCSRAVAAEMIKHGSQIDSTFFRWAENRFNHLNAESPAVCNSSYCL